MTTKTTPEARRQPTPLSPAIIAAMQSGEELGDAACPGLRARATSKGEKVFFYRYRAADGALRQIKVGQFGPLTLAAARKQVEKLRLEREQGVDPQAEKKQARQRARTARVTEKAKGYTVATLVAEYCTEVLSRQKRGSESERLLYREFLPKLGNRPAADVTKRELLDEVIRPMMQRAPRCATMLLSRIRCAYQYAIDQARLPDEFNSPTLGIKGAAQVRRKRAFTDAELSTFLRWLPSSPYSRTVRDAFRLVMYTGCRSGEVVAAEWRDVDLERGVWTIRETKNGEPHDVMLSRQAAEVFKFRKGMNAVFVFPGKTGKEHARQKLLGLAQYVARNPKNEGQSPQDPIEVGWTTHDLRRTVATGLARLGCPRVVQDRILNHTDTSIGAIYDRHGYDGEAREWLQRWADHLDRLTIQS